MANWKEKGFVPDSDDEDDLDQNTQNKLSREDYNCRAPDIGSLGVEKVEELGDASLDKNQDPQCDDVSPTIEYTGLETLKAPTVIDCTSGENNSTSVDDVTSVYSELIDQDELPLAPIVDLEASANISAIGRELQSSPLVDPLSSPRAFKVPNLFWEELEQNHEDETAACKRDILMEDDVSKSYVQISSPASSILSSPPSSLPDIFEYQESKNATPNLNTGEDSPERNQNNAPTIECAGSQVFQESDYPMKRALRHRNPIQLHPYIVEQEKYRQTLKARGIAPLRFIQSQGDRSYSSCKVSSTNHGTEDEGDSQEINSDEFRSQPTDKYCSPVPSSCPLRPTGTLKNIDHPNEFYLTTLSLSEDDETFPDVNMLLKKKQHLPLVLTPAARRESKNLTQTQGRRFNKEYNCTENSPGIAIKSNFGFPASPAESSPTLQENEDFPSLQTGLKLKESVTTELITPANSTMRLSVDPVTIDSDIDLNNDDPFASSPCKNSPTPSSSDESVQLREVYKRIRGVLPASHLRLDAQKAPQDLSRTERDSSASPIRILPRKGVAIPKTRKNDSSHHLSFLDGLQFLVDNSEDENDDEAVKSFNPSGNSISEMRSFLGFNQPDLAEEDSIDAMLPSRERHSSNKSLNSSKKKNIANGRIQSRITDHLKRPRERDIQSNRPSKKRKFNSISSRRMGLGKSNSPKLLAFPRLSILDVADNTADQQCKLPNFIKIATRTARSRKDRGRQSPSTKFIRLATFEDTEEVQSVFEDWKRGRIIPKKLLKESNCFTKSSTSSLNQVGEDKKIDSGQSTSNEWDSHTKRRKFIVQNRSIQESLDNFITRKGIARLPNFPRPCKSGSGYKKRPEYRNLTRPAQLESISSWDFSRHSTAAFKSSKKRFDALYLGCLRRPAEASNFQICRFLKEKIACPSVEMSSNVDYPEAAIKSPQPAPVNNPRHNKRPPHRVDANAARYRQPSTPLILDCLAHEEVYPIAHGNRLLGLGKFGIKYPVHFDILPLQQGTFFHNSTFIGSGLLERTLKGVSPDIRQSPREKISFGLGERSFSWSTWNEVSASELGICFDSLSDCLADSRPLDSPSVHPKRIIMFVLHYVQQNISFDGSLDQHNFLSRMLQVLHEFSTRLDISLEDSTTQANERIEILSICSVLVLHLIQTARAGLEASTLILGLEDLLAKIASQCIKTLLGQGLECIRKLYDDLQYHLIREVGIDNNQYAIQGWLILIKVLGSAQLPRKSFWDITNSQLRLNEIDTLFDSTVMDKLWYSIYTILPLCEFDDLGQVVAGQRQKSLFDNWYIPQQLLKRVLTLYKLNQRQSPGFNAYFRTLLTRCHYLMVEWGWWNSSVLIGSIFDFFASQSLSHLRNEEIYHSPRFLEEPGAVPSLEIQPEDCCFHIFLKLVALRFKHLHQSQDLKSIRNLGTRLLPNHDRQYPKEEDIHQRDLASLRNHHDLLCTLFCSMPPNQRPSISLIQELVIPDRSHKEACLINIRSWEILSRFIVTSTSDPIFYQPLKNWQLTFFEIVHEQYIGAEAEVRQQAEEIHKSSGDMMTETRITEIILTNKRNIIISMCRSVNAMGNAIKAASCDAMVKQAFNNAVLVKALDPNIYNSGRLSDPLFKEVIQVLVYYMDQTDKLYPSILSEASCNNFETGDSQDSIDMATWGRIEMVSLLESSINYLRPVIRKQLSAHKDGQLEISIAIRLIDCWGRLICAVTENESKKFQSFLRVNSNEIFQSRRFCKTNCHYWTLFISKLLHYGKSLEEFKYPGFDIGLEWLLSLTRFEALSTSDVELTFQMYLKGYYLCTTPEIHKLDRTQIFRAVICEMSNLLLENKTETLIGLTSKQAQRHFSEILGEVQDSIQRTLESLEPSSHSHMTYLAFARSVITNIKCFASGFRNLTEFFIHPSAYYWPHDADPNLYAAGIIAYCVRLNQQPEKTSFELFYYLYSGWTNALVSSRLDEYKDYIKSGMIRREFTQFMLIEFVPAILEVGFNSNGWLLCSTFLPCISHRVSRLLDTLGPESSWAFQQFINLLRIIMNGASNVVRRFQHDIRGAHESHRGILAVVFQFWMQSAAIIRQYMERYPEFTETIEEVTDALSSFIYNSLQSFEMGKIYHDCPVSQFEVKGGKLMTQFISYFTREIQGCWQFTDDSNFGVVIKARSKETSSEQRFRFTLGDVLRGEVAIYEILFENKFGVKLPVAKNMLIQRLMP